MYGKTGFFLRLLVDMAAFSGSAALAMIFAAGNPELHGNATLLAMLLSTLGGRIFGIKNLLLCIGDIIKNLPCFLLPRPFDWFFSDEVPTYGLLLILFIAALLLIIGSVRLPLSGPFIVGMLLAYALGLGANLFYKKQTGYGSSRREKKKASEAAGADEAEEKKKRQLFIELLVRILVLVAQADGHFSKNELAVILNFFRFRLFYGPEELSQIKQLVQHAMNSPAGMDELLRRFRNNLESPARLILLELVFQLVHTKNPPLASELALARDIARSLHITGPHLRNIEAKYMHGSKSERRQRKQSWQYEKTQRQDEWTRQERQEREQRMHETSPPSQEAQYYATLGLEPGVGFSTIKRAYRKLCMQYHPDKVAHLGEEFKRVAEEKMKEINAAYEYFEKKFR